MKSGKRRHRTRRSEGGPSEYELLEGNMAGASTLENLSPELSKVAERAQREPEEKISLAGALDR
jgi:hypothetical protein